MTSASFSSRTGAGAVLGVGLLALAAGAPARAQQAGDVLWRFELGSPFSSDEVAVGADGTIYAKDNLHLYALGADGTLRWTRDELGGGQPIDFLDDGAIVTGLGDTIWALEADGSTRWMFSYDSNNFQEQIEAGPNVGPDGNIYAVTSTDGSIGLGAFSLTPQGELRWADPGAPILDEINAGTNGFVSFTSDRLIFPFKTTAPTPPLVYGYDFGGAQTLFVDFTCTSVPRAHPLDFVVLSGQCGIQAIAADGTQILWTTPLGDVHLLPQISADGTIYTGTWSGPLVALDADGSILWTSETAVDVTSVLAVRQDVGRVLYSGATSFGVPDFVAGVDAATGERLWSFDLMSVDGFNEFVFSATAPTSPDGTVAYFSTRFAGNGVPGAVYAVQLVGANTCAADLNGDGMLTDADYQLFLEAYDAQDPTADCDGNGSLNNRDVVCYRKAFRKGCD
jgi:outer membrane protein assembly factor BamB